MKDRNVSSYNLLYAQQILNDLATKKRSAPRLNPREEGKPYVRLMPVKSDKLEAGPATFAPASPEVATPPAAPAPPQTFRDWESCIAWCIDVTRAEAAFVVDSGGFIIATRGRIPGHGFECTGAELIYTMDQLERIDPEAGKLLWIDLDFNKRRLVGFVTPEEENEYFIVGLVAPEAAYNASKHLISKHIIESLPTMN